MKAEHFIAKFEATKEEDWCIGNYVDGEKLDALGFCGHRKGSYYHGKPPTTTEEGMALRRIIHKASGHDVLEINDGAKYPGGAPIPGLAATPRARILYALYKAKEMGL